MLAIQEVDRTSTTQADSAPVPVTVAVALPLSQAELDAIQDGLGVEYVVFDIRCAPPESDVVVVPPCSPGTIRAVCRTFPMAEVVVVEPGLCDDSLA
jgi:hypothetical protein